MPLWPTSSRLMINDCSKMEVETVTLIDVTLPMTLLTHSEMGLVESKLTVSLPVFLSQSLFSPLSSVSCFSLALHQVRQVLKLTYLGPTDLSVC